MAAGGEAQPVAVIEVTAVELPSIETRKDWFVDWADATHQARKLAFRDRAYFDNDQWTREEREELDRRRQPVLTKNKIAGKINGIIGEEIEKRVDPVALPRTPQHANDARAMTDALRFVDDEQNFDDVRSSVFGSMLIEGIGGALKGIEEIGGRYKHTLTFIEYDRLVWDPHSRAHDFSDARFLGLVQWMDLEDAQERWPDKADALASALETDASGVSGVDSETDDIPAQWSDKRRQRVKVVEMYFRVGQDWYKSCFTSFDLEDPSRSFYVDEDGRAVCPLVMESCYVDRQGNRYGVVRQLISPQDEINKRSSKSLHLLSVRQVIAERDAVRDPQTFQTELAKPDGFAEVEPGALEQGRIQISPTADLAQGQVTLLQQANADIDSIGPSQANIPELPTSASGRAFLARQKAASRELGRAFDHLRSWTLRVYRLDWWCIRQLWTEEMWLRVRDDKELEGYRFVALNRQITRAERLAELMQQGVPLPSALETAAGNVAPIVMMQAQRDLQMLAQGRQLPPEQQQQALQAVVMRNEFMQEPVTENQVAQTQVDIVLDVAPETAILAQEEFATLTEVLPTVASARPDIAPNLVKMLIQASSLPDKRELLEQMNKGPDPQQAQQQQAMQQMQMAQLQAGVQVTQTQAQLNAAKAAAEQAKVQQAGAKVPSEIERNQAAAMRDAASAGEKAAFAPPGVM